MTETSEIGKRVEDHVDRIADWLGHRAATLGGVRLLASFDRATARLVKQTRRIARSKMQSLRGLDPARKFVNGRVAEGVLVAWLLFTLGSTAAELPAAIGCLAQWVKPLFGFGPPACSTGTLDGIGLVWFSQTLVGALLFWVVGRWALAVTNEIAGSQARMVPEAESRARVVIMGLSEPAPAPAKQIEQATAAASDWRAFAGPYQAGQELGGNWRQAARIIGYHLDKLEAVYLLPSKQSAEAIEHFRTYCRTLCQSARNIDP